MNHTIFQKVQKNVSCKHSFTKDWFPRSCLIIHTYTQSHTHSFLWLHAKKQTFKEGFRAYVRTLEKGICKQSLLPNHNSFFCVHNVGFSLSLQALSHYRKATRWAFPSRKSHCWAWYQTPQRCSAPYRAAFPCWAPHPSTRLLWLKSRGVCHPRSAWTHHSWEEFYAGRGLNSFIMTAWLDWIYIFFPFLTWFYFQP